MTQYPTVYIPSSGNARPRHVRTVLPVAAALVDRVPDPRSWCLRQGDQWVPTQAKWLGRSSPAGRALCVDAIVSAAGPMSLEPSVGPVHPEDPVQLRTDPTCATLETSGVRVELTRDNDPRLTINGREHRPVLHYLSNGTRFTSHRGERHVTVVERGPVRAAAEVSGTCLSETGQPGLSYRLRFDLFAGLSTVVARMWFFHTLPGVESLPVEQLSLTWSLPAEMADRHVMQLHYGMSGTPRFVTTSDTLRAAVGHDGATAWRLLDAAPLQDKNVYPACLMPPCDEASSWLAASGPDGWLAVAVDDVREMLPKGLRLAPGQLDIEIWPDWAGPMVLPQGRSRSVTACFAFGAGPNDRLDRGVFESALASTSAEPVLADWPANAAGGFFDLAELLPLRAEGAQRFDDYLSRVACPPTVADMFDLGDTPDPGYQTTYLSTGRRLEPIVPESQRRRIQYQAGTHFAAAPWSDLSQFGQVWANNEYDVIWCIASEALRGGRADLLRPLRWYARHAIEVDFVHHSDHRWKHRCTPAHSANHTFANAYPSHFWTEGVLAYYLLSGDEDALEFARAIGDKVIEFFNEPMQVEKLWHPTRELGWALVATAALAAVDEDPRYEQISRRIADELVSVPLDDAYTAQMVRYSFGFASILLGLDRWHRLDPQPRYRDWIAAAGRKCAEQVRQTTSVVPSMTIAIVYLGYKHSGDAQLLRAGMRLLEQLMDGPWWHSPPPYVKPFAMLHRPLARFFAAAHREKLLQCLDYRF